MGRVKAFLVNKSVRFCVVAIFRLGCAVDCGYSAQLQTRRHVYRFYGHAFFLISPNKHDDTLLCCAVLIPFSIVV